MCGRFGLTRTPNRLVGWLVDQSGRLPDDVAQSRFNIAPTQRALAVVNEESPTNEICVIKWIDRQRNQPFVRLRSGRGYANREL